jgi:hypothetical protein
VDGLAAIHLAHSICSQRQKSSPRSSKDLELSAELCIAGRSDTISPLYRASARVRLPGTSYRDEPQALPDPECSSTHTFHTANSTLSPHLQACSSLSRRRCSTAAGVGGPRARGRRSIQPPEAEWRSGGTAWRGLGASFLISRSLRRPLVPSVSCLQGV